uniref:Uncharacterized protein n=1 Tax=Anguilla anguilla TaxID=7936 RepID=A0A0E9Q061_ANGAN
MRAASFEQHCV